MGRLPTYMRADIVDYIGPWQAARLSLLLLDAIGSQLQGDLWSPHFSPYATFSLYCCCCPSAAESLPPAACRCSVSPLAIRRLESAFFANSTAVFLNGHHSGGNTGIKLYYDAHVSYSI